MQLDDKNFSRKDCVQSVVLVKKKTRDVNACNERDIGYQDAVDICITSFGWIKLLLKTTRPL